MSDVGGSIIATGVLLCLSALFSGLTLGLMGLDQVRFPPLHPHHAGTVWAGPADGWAAERGDRVASLARQSLMWGAHAVVEIRAGCRPCGAVDAGGSRFAEVCWGDLTQVGEMGDVVGRERKGIPCSPRIPLPAPRCLMHEVAGGEGTSPDNISWVPA